MLHAPTGSSDAVTSDSESVQSDRGLAAWSVKGGTIDLTHPIVMGVVNVTPDSFSDAGNNLDPLVAIETGISMAESGAAIIDVGGESTRPGSTGVPVSEELKRVMPVVEGLAGSGISVSIDTSKPAVARAALEAGAVVVNDVTGITDDEMIEICVDHGAGIVIMHMLGDPRTMQDDPHYDDVVAEVVAFLLARADRAMSAGVDAAQIVLDPGIGFGKTVDHNLALMASIDQLGETGFPVLIGASRKRFLSTILEPIRGTTTPAERDNASLAA
ncbi:MAG: dihydropteroate synthase, partial [Armatimonadetes bacterium]